MTPEEIKKWRTDRGITQEQAAAAMKISKYTWISWEQGQRTPHPTLPIFFEWFDANHPQFKPKTATNNQ